MTPNDYADVLERAAETNEGIEAVLRGEQPEPSFHKPVDAAHLRALATAMRNPEQLLHLVGDVQAYSHETVDWGQPYWIVTPRGN